MGTPIKVNNKVLASGVHIVTSPYGTRTLNGTTKKHNGVDLVSNTKANGSGYNTTDYIVAYDAGTVTAVLNTCGGTTPATGNYVKVKHSGGFSSIYMHMKKGSISVKVGDKVKKGQRLGYMGNTGRSTGAHLHFGLSLNGSYVNPVPYLQGGGGETVSITLNTIQQGSKGSQVKTLQRLLNSMGYKGKNGKSLTVDGVAGENCTHAVKSYQKVKKLNADGVVGAKTWRSILGA